MPQPTQRDALDTLTRARLAELVRGFEVDAPARAAKGELVDALARSRRASFERILQALKLAELKKICRATDLSPTARTKAILVERLLGREAEPAVAQTNGADEEIDLESSLKKDLRQFAVSVSGGFRGRGFEVEFAQGLLRCFGWAAEDIPGESPCTLPVVEHGKRSSRKVALSWPERRVLVEVVKRDELLDGAWRGLMSTCLQVSPVPQYVILSNLRDLHLYDLARDRDTPRLAITVDDLPKYSEAFPFLARDWKPGTTPTIINVAKVSREVADLVAKLYRSLKAEHPERQDDVIRFTLQCIITMFAEDIGLLPQEHFTSLLYEGAADGDAEARLAELFRLMSTPMDGAREVPYFNGGLFAAPVTLPLGGDQLRALTKAAEANWTYVDPHIFGSVFQGIMDDTERHAQGAHYTAREDIMRVVGPTIVDPWRNRIQAATTLAELRELRKQLSQFRVLDPACGSGNFLYVSFRELYKLETELLARMYEFPSVANDKKNRPSWGSGIPTTNFFGIDINPFAVELAKTTLNIAKKIAFDERREVAAQVLGQFEMDLDPSLPLDNLDENIVCADALFCDWPRADAIVGNPPFLGGQKLRRELGDDYLASLKEAFPAVNGRSDLCAYWFRRAHDLLAAGGRAGLIGTNTVREGLTREAALDYVVENQGTITNAVSSRVWPGEAVVHVSMVNWLKGAQPGPHVLVVDDQTYQLPSIPTHLQLHVSLGSAEKIGNNGSGRASLGVTLGTTAFKISDATAKKLAADPTSTPCIKAVATATDLLRGRLTSNPDYVIDMSDRSNLGAARRARAAFRHLEAHVRDDVFNKAKNDTAWHERWWQPGRPRHQFLREASGLSRIVACSRHAARPVFVFLSRSFLPTESLQVFAFEDDYSFGVLQSSAHWAWAVAKGSKIKGDTRYTMDVWNTFPWPQALDVARVGAVVGAAKHLRSTRDRLMKENGWSLRSLYQSAEVTGPHPLKQAQAGLDAAVDAAYDLPAGRDRLEFLLELNLCVAEDERDGFSVLGSGLPTDIGDIEQWTSRDSIEPPPLGREEQS